MGDCVRTIMTYLAIFLIGWLIGFGMAIYAIHRKRGKP